MSAAEWPHPGQHFCTDRQEPAGATGALLSVLNLNARIYKHHLERDLAKLVRRRRQAALGSADMQSARPGGQRKMQVRAWGKLAHRESLAEA